jgi:hypothetical protein
MPVVVPSVPTRFEGTPVHLLTGSLVEPEERDGIAVDGEARVGVNAAACRAVFDGRISSIVPSKKSSWPASAAPPIRNSSFAGAGGNVPAL